jgi:heme a synthase
VPKAELIAGRGITISSQPLVLPSILVALVYAQILVGALMRHLGAGLAIPDFPLSFGRIVPNFTSAAIVVHYAHRVGALLVAVTILAVAGQLFRLRAPHALRRLAGALVVLVVLQIVLGAVTIWTAKHPTVTSLHVAIGALMLALSLLLALVARTLAGRDDRAALPLVASEAPA